MAVTPWLGSPNDFSSKINKGSLLDQTYLLEGAIPDNLPYPKELTICSYRMAWHCYILLPTFPRPVVKYAYRFSIRRRSRLPVIILGLSKRRRASMQTMQQKNSYVSYAVCSGKQAWLPSWTEQIWQSSLWRVNSSICYNMR